jgi:hypothetical protein
MDELEQKANVVIEKTKKVSELLGDNPTSRTVNNERWGVDITFQRADNSLIFLREFLEAVLKNQNNLSLMAKIYDCLNLSNHRTDEFLDKSNDNRPTSIFFDIYSNIKKIDDFSLTANPTQSATAQRDSIVSNINQEVSSLVSKLKTTNSLAPFDVILLNYTRNIQNQVEATLLKKTEQLDSILKNIESLKSEAAVSVEEAKASLTEVSKEAKGILSNLRHVSAIKFIGQITTLFSSEATRYTRSLCGWFVLEGALIGFSIFWFLCGTYYIEATLPTFLFDSATNTVKDITLALYYFAGIKLITWVVITGLLYIPYRFIKAAWVLKNDAKHRAVCSEAIPAIIDALDKDSPIRNELISVSAKTLLGPIQTGLLDNNESNQSISVENMLPKK